MDIPIKVPQPYSRRMAIKAKGGKWNPIAVRLRILRVAIFNENASQFARRIKVGIAVVGNVEIGYPLSINLANKIRFAVPGMTLDWLYHGEERGMPMELVSKLRQEAAKPEYSPPP